MEAVVIEMRRWVPALTLTLGLVCGLWGCGAALSASPAPIAADGGATIEPQEEPPIYMALTFDDGPGRYTEALLDGLCERGVRATFFLIGKQLGDYEEVVLRMAADGHQIGNHSYDHADLSVLSCEAAVEDIARCDAALQALLGKNTYWVRPPYGLLCAPTLGRVPAPLVTWSVDTEDWKTKDENAILDHIYRESFDGCIILLHDQYPATLSAALTAIDHLQQQGVCFVTVEELFALRGVTPETGKLYRKVPAA